MRILTSGINITYLYEILKSEQEERRERKQLIMRKVAENPKKRSCVNMLLNVVEINTATARHSHI
jgi:hypothetical protein